MRTRFSASLFATTLALLAACGGRSDKDTSAGGGKGGTGASGGTGGAAVAGTGGTSTSAGTGGSVAGTGGSTAGRGGGPAGGSGGRGGSAGHAGAPGAGSGGAAGSDVGGAAGMGGVAGAQSCQELSIAYSNAYEEATTCHPNAANDECTLKLHVGLSCGCGSFVNPDNADAIARMSDAEDAYRAQECRGQGTCGECLEPIRGHCTDAGRCENTYPGNGKSCKVAGVVYRDGEGGIQDPTSCNTCSCYDGQLACTEIGGCEKPCPDGYGFGTGCAQCGPTDACEIPEYDCFKACFDTCDSGHVCFGGLCVGVCG